MRISKKKALKPGSPTAKRARLELTRWAPDLGHPAVVDGQVDEGLGDGDVAEADGYQHGQGDPQAGDELRARSPAGRRWAQRSDRSGIRAEATDTAMRA